MVRVTVLLVVMWCDVIRLLSKLCQSVHKQDHVLFVVYLVDVLVPGDYLCERSIRDGSSNVISQYNNSNVIHRITTVMQFTG